MEYPYLEVTPGFLAPLVPLELWKGGRRIVAVAYIDSGASLSVFRMKVAESLGLKWRDGKRLQIIVGNGDKMEVFLFDLRVKFSGLVFSARIGFSQELGVGFNLIGRVSFFERFRICFNDHDKVVTTLRLF